MKKTLRQPRTKRNKAKSDPRQAEFFAAITACGTGVLEMRPLAQGSFNQTGRAFLRLDRLNGDLAAFVHKHYRDQNYFGPALRRDDSSGKLENCSTLGVLYVDQDFKSTPEAEARRRLAECPLPPSIIVHSGGGLHIYWLLREPLDLQDTDDCALAYSLLRRLCACLNGDSKVAEPAHILRVPGTLNYKYVPPRRVLIEELHDDRQYNIGDFAELPEPSADKTKGPFVAPEKIREGERNSWLYKIGRSLKSKGLSPEAIRAALHAENRAKCDPPCDDAGMERVFQSVFEQADRPEFRSLEERLAQLRALSLEDLKATWHLYLHGLNAVDRQAVLKEIARLMNVGINTLKQHLNEQQAESKQAEQATLVGPRVVLTYYPQDVCKVAHRVEAAMLARTTDGECVRFGNTVSRVVIDALPGAHQADQENVPAVQTAQLDFLTQPKLLPLVERAVVLQVGHRAIGVPSQILDQILVNPHGIPRISGLVTHPIVTTAGRIISANGIDPSTRLLLYGPVITELRPYSKDEARKGVKEITQSFLDGFEFETTLDEASALALLLTTVERKMMDMAPGFLLTAAQQSLGKTTLGRRTHLMVTGADAPVFTWPDDDEVEVQKLLLSTLLRNPAMVVIDNIGDGMTFRSGALSAAMTSATKQGRLLGHNRDAVVATNVTFVLTGNHVGLANDEVSRWIPIRLTTSAISPHTRKFRHPDIIRHGLEIREAVLRHVVGLVAGYRCGTERIEPSSRFPLWDTLVRQPLMWAGQPDVGTVFDANVAASPELGAHLALLTALYKHYGLDQKFSAVDLVTLIQTTFGHKGFIEIILALHAKDPESSRSVGHVLTKACGRTARVENQVVILKQSSTDGLVRYRLKKLDEVG